MDLVKEIEKNNYTMDFSKNGARCYQNVKNIIKLSAGQKFLAGYLHLVYPKLEDKDFKAFVNELGIELNNDLVSFYKKYNGCVLFSGAFKIYGFGRVCKDGNYFTSRESDICLPFHLLDENDGKIKEDAVKIGSICNNPLYCNNKTGAVTLNNNGTLEQWKNLDSCIEDVYKRLYSQYLPMV